MADTQASVEIRDEESGETQTIPVSGLRVVFGRAGAADITLGSALVSRRHAEIFQDAAGLWRARDLGSRNGSLLNGLLLEEPHVLDPGDRLQIGPYSIAFRPAGSPPAVADPGLTVADIGLTVGDAGVGPVRALSEMEVTTISAEQIKTITALNGELLAAERADERLRSLCETLIDRVFLGGCAMVLELPSGGSIDDVTVLLAPVSRQPVESPRLSRTLLNEVARTESAVMASSSPWRADGEFVELSAIAEVDEAVMACPIGQAEDGLVMLYLTVPGDFAAPAWLALVALAAEQFQQAEAAWKARRVAQEKALLESELEQAQHIQMMWVPEDIEVDGVSVSFGFEPCSWVGGDYVDGVSLGDGRLLLTVMDVCGKGLQAALITNGLHTSVHLLAAQGCELPELVGLINDHLQATLPPASFVTMVIVAIDPLSGEVEAVNSGHPPLVIVSSDLEVRQLEYEPQLPLGAFPIDVETTHECLTPGDLLFAYSDGLTEMFDAQEQMLGLGGLHHSLRDVYRDVLEANRAAVDPRAIGEALRARLTAFRGDGSLSDDQSFFLALKR